MITMLSELWFAAVLLFVAAIGIFLSHSNAKKEFCSIVILTATAVLVIATTILGLLLLWKV